MVDKSSLSDVATIKSRIVDTAMMYTVYGLDDTQWAELSDKVTAAPIRACVTRGGEDDYDDYDPAEVFSGQVMINVEGDRIHYTDGREPKPVSNEVEGEGTIIDRLWDFIAESVSCVELKHGYVILRSGVKLMLRGNFYIDVKKGTFSPDPKVVLERLAAFRYYNEDTFSLEEADFLAEYGYEAEGKRDADAPTYLADYNGDTLMHSAWYAS